jgi:archaellin
MNLSTQDIYSKTTPTLTFTVTDAAGVAVDLTDSTVTLTAKVSRDATTAKFVKTCTLATDPTTGICSAKLTTTDTATPGSFILELHIEYADVDVTTYVVQMCILTITQILYDVVVP